MIRRPPRSTLDRSSAASDVYKRQLHDLAADAAAAVFGGDDEVSQVAELAHDLEVGVCLSLIHISEPTRPY